LVAALLARVDVVVRAEEGSVGVDESAMGDLFDEDMFDFGDELVNVT